MKFFIYAFSFLAFLTEVCNSAMKCDQGRVPNQMNFCIQPQYIQGCVRYQTEIKCIECEKGYRLGDKGCDALQFGQRQQKLVGCLERSEDNLKCQNCAKNFIRINGTCQVGVENCHSYNQKNTCIKCLKGYTLVLNQCRQNRIVGCKIPSGGHTCKQCQKPFQLKNLYCYIDNCNTINDYGCVSCLCGYYLTQERTCKKIQYGCLRYQRGRCIECVQHYRLKGAYCQIQGCISYAGDSCIKCQQHYQNVNGGCLFKNCIDWFNNQCYYCQSGYRLQSGICVAEDQQNCKV